MKSNIKLYTTSFKKVGSCTIDMLEEAIDNLYQVISCIYEIDNIYMDSSLYEQNIFDGKKLEEILYSPHPIIERDLQSRLRNIFEKIIFSEKEQPDAYLIFYSVADVIEEIHIHNIYEWRIFKRKHLEDCNFSKEDFVYISKYIFPQLYFHERNRETIDKILVRYKKKIIKALSILNDHLAECITDVCTPKQITNKLNTFFPHDTDSSPESCSSRRNLCTFKFLNDKKQYEDICCELHIKIHSDDKNRIPTKNQPFARIYFNKGKTNIQNGKILIGHIGEHL